MIDIHAVCFPNACQSSKRKIVRVILGELQEAKPAALGHQEVVLDVAGPSVVIMLLTIEWLQGIGGFGFDVPVFPLKCLLGNAKACGGRRSR